MILTEILKLQQVTNGFLKTDEGNIIKFKSKFLILDEPTASLDAETERKVIENLARWGKERIVFIITHRLSTIRSADQIILIHEGNISESGTHDELMNSQGPYRDFVDAELGLRAKN